MATQTVHVRIDERLYHRFRAMFPFYGQVSRVITLFIHELVKHADPNKPVTMEQVNAAAVEAARRIVEDTTHEL